MRIAAELTDSVRPPGRQSDRTRVRMNAAYREGSGRGVVDVVDMSTSGAKIESHLTLRPDTYIWLKLPGLEACHARIAWVRRHEAGCEFVRPLHPAVFAQILSGSQ